MVTKKLLQSLEPRTIFASGICFGPKNTSDKIIKWVAIRGGIEDWAMYYCEYVKDMHDIYVAGYGEKMYLSEVKNIMLADEEGYNLYRR
jgi:hypothetical protein